MFKILLGGSPCTHWSIAQNKNRETTAEGIGWELFKNYVIAKEKFKPDFYLYENNKSAAAAIKRQIAVELGHGLTTINSALVSAQNRERIYGTPMGESIPQPEDREILLRDVLETTYPVVISPSGNSCNFDVIAPINDCTNGKAYALKANYYKSAPANFFNGGGHFPQTGVAEAVAGRFVGRRINSTGHRDDYNTDIERFQRFEVNNDPQKTNCLSTVNKDNVVAAAVKELDNDYFKGAMDGSLVGQIVNNGTYKNGGQPSQQYRVFSCEGKSVCVDTDSRKYYMVPTGIDYVPHPDSDIIINDNAMRCQRRDVKHSTIQGTHVNFVDGKSQTVGTTHVPMVFDDSIGKTIPVYEVRDGQITIKGKTYPIKLPDSMYIIRKLTVTECERLQTLPDGYTQGAGVSNTQCYRGLGNGWTAEVIIHILKQRMADLPRDTPILALSMYDGIGTGRYCLDAMGFTNVRYFAYENDKYPMQIANHNYPDIIQCGDAFQIREEGWSIRNR